ncbi:hypothetical protein N0V94_001817 [Neodidymelliopsis sp. IMI 364377]|nr:hypothetical protein N0V94_001817 [Neodidymelliopsis sp. IMI 364377]
MTLFGLSTADPRGRGGLIEDPPSSLHRDFETMWQPHAAKQTGVWKLSLCARVRSEHPATKQHESSYSLFAGDEGIHAANFMRHQGAMGGSKNKADAARS